jgi:hypothetical protein
MLCRRTSTCLRVIDTAAALDPGGQALRAKLFSSPLTRRAALAADERRVAVLRRTSDILRGDIAAGARS